MFFKKKPKLLDQNLDNWELGHGSSYAHIRHIPSGTTIVTSDVPFSIYDLYICYMDSSKETLYDPELAKEAYDIWKRLKVIERKGKVDRFRSVCGAKE